MDDEELKECDVCGHAEDEYDLLVTLNTAMCRDCLFSEVKEGRLSVLPKVKP
jgi:hypothetical protein